MAIAIDDVIRVSYFMRLFGQRVMNIFHLRVTTAPTITPDIAALSNLATSMGNVAVFPLLDWLPLSAPELIFDEVRCQKVFPVRTTYGKSFIGTTGTHADGCTTPNVAVSVERRSNHAGRFGVGHIQLAGIPATKYTAGLVDSTYLTAVQACWTQLTNAVTLGAGGGAYKFCLYGGRLVIPDDDIQDVQAEATVRTMHRRTVGLGI